MNHYLRSFSFVLLASLLLPAPDTSAQTQTLSEVQHSSWAGHDGAPLGIRAIAIGPEGLLYLATFSGLYSFDGTAFELIPIPGIDPALASTIHNIFFTRSGDLLLMLAHGAPVLMRKSRGLLLNHTDGSAIETMNNPQQTPTGQLWAVLNERQLVTLGKDSVWHTIPDPGQGHAHITQIFADSQGAVWLVVDDRLYRRSPGGQILPTSIFVYGRGKFMAGLHSDIWIASSGPATSTTPAHHLQHLDNLGNPIETRDVSEPLTAAFPAADGSLWLLTTQSVLLHLPQGMLERGISRFNLLDWHDRLTLHTAVRDDGAYAFLPTRDGSLWIGGLGGIERFKDAALVPLLPNATPGLWQHCFEHDGAQWIIDARSTLYLRTPDGTMVRRGTGAQELYCSAAGNLFRDDAGLSILNESRIVPLPALPGLRGYGNHYIFTGATRTTDGSILASAAGGAIGRSLWRFSSGQWRQFGSRQEGPEITAMYSTPSGAVYLGFRDGTARTLEPGATQTRSIGKAENGTILGFAQIRQRLFAYGKSGVAIWDRNSFSALLFVDVQSTSEVSGIAQSNDGDLWLNGAKGIVRVPARELEAALQDPSHQCLSNDVSEGDYIGPAAVSLFSQSAQSGTDGRVWFDTVNGIVSVAPWNLTPVEPPPLVVKGALADGSPLPPNRTLPPGVNTLSIRYIGVDFSDPSGISYSYWLDGYDNAWQAVGSRTEAVYTHLRAGRYTFTVKARNAYGSWTIPVKLEPFVVLPHFYEKRWFLAAITFLLISLIWIVIQLRLRAAAADNRRRADERADERILIARDLHDTLLQGVQGLLMTFHAAIERVPADHDSRPSLEHALGSAEKLIIEGRDRVKGLRGAHVSGEELGQLFQTVAEDLACGERFQLKISCGSAKTILRDDVAAEVFLAGREALVNAARHAQASRIVLRLHFNPGAFSLECEDDGVGFDPRQTRSEHLPRWGIPGMHERIKGLRGFLRIRSTAGRGTLVLIFIKARFAYR